MVRRSLPDDRAPQLPDPLRFHEVMRTPGPRARFAFLVVAVLGLLVAVSIWRPIDEEGLRAVVDPLGWAAPLAFIPVSVGLALVLVPGALLATAAGLLFGTWVGFAVSMVCAILTALVARAIAVRSGREGFEEVAGRRMGRAAGALQRSGTWGVVVQRLIPGVSDGACNYGWGVVGITARQIALGTLIGAAPRALGYTALGDSLDDLTSPTGLLATVMLVGTAILGAVLAARAAHGHRRDGREAASEHARK
jgi:uncharacterized membrane protein YdjX (TVP38/TMEM64 family)